MTTIEEAKAKLPDIVSHGLVDGMGTGALGSLCIESAICLAMGEPHSDRASCVHAVDRAFAIGINDAAWSSPQARAAALLPLGLAQLGTAGTDRTAWVQRVVEGTIRRVLPIALRAAVAQAPSHADALEDAARRCETKGTEGAACAAYDAALAAAAARAALAAAAARAAYDAPRAAACAAALAAYDAAYADPGHVLRIAVEVAMDAYRAEGRA